VFNGFIFLLAKITICIINNFNFFQELISSQNIVNEWKQIYILPFKATACTKLHWVQFRINHNILATNYFLKKIKIIDDTNCNFCQKENETIEHIFWGCENVQNLLGQVSNHFFSFIYIYQTGFKRMNG
jgi:hypothetical protein